jgi:hypothetical protein
VTSTDPDNMLPPETMDEQAIQDDSSSYGGSRGIKQKQNLPNTKTSYYVRDKFKPLNQNQNNIEKMLLKFMDEQEQFTNVIFQNQRLLINNQEQMDHTQSIMSSNSIKRVSN